MCAHLPPGRGMGWGGGTGRKGVPQTRMPKRKHPRNLTHTLRPLRYHGTRLHSDVCVCTCLNTHMSCTHSYTCVMLSFIQSTNIQGVCSKSLALHLSLFWSHPYAHTYTPAAHTNGTSQGLRCGASAKSLKEPSKVFFHMAVKAKNREISRTAVGQDVH